MLYSIMCSSTFLPLLQACSFLLVRLHILGSELSAVMEHAAVLSSAPETTFCEAAHGVVQVRC